MSGAITNTLSNKINHIAGFVDGLVLGPSPQSHCSACSSSYSHGSNPCPSNSCYDNCGHYGCSSAQTLIVVQQQQPSHSSSASSYPDCQCDYLFNSAGQGNCNAAGARSHTSDRWCYIAEDVNGKWIEAQWACPDAVRSDVHSGRSEKTTTIEGTTHSVIKYLYCRFWSRTACDTPRHGHG